MNREKQIEDMAKVIFENSPIPSVWHSDAVKFAQALYKAGYRKASDVAREIFEEIINALKYTRFASTLEKDGTLVYILSLEKKYTESEKDNA